MSAGSGADRDPSLLGLRPRITRGGGGRCLAGGETLRGVHVTEAPEEGP